MEKGGGVSLPQDLLYDGSRILPLFALMPTSAESRSEKANQAIPQDTVAEPVASGAPAYFHLLWDHELDNLAPILDSILSRREQVMAHWHQLYILHFGDARSLSDREFMEIFG